MIIKKKAPNHPPQMLFKFHFSPLVPKLSETPVQNSPDSWMRAEPQSCRATLDGNVGTTTAAAAAVAGVAGGRQRVSVYSAASKTTSSTQRAGTRSVETL